MRGRAASRLIEAANGSVAVSSQPGVVARQGSFANDSKLGRLAAASHHARKWLRIDRQGSLSFVQADKHTLSVELSVPTRDLRILDPMVANSYPTAILIREKALVVHLENIRMIICKDQVLMISVPMPLQPSHSMFPTPESPFVQELVLRITQMPPSIQEGGIGLMNSSSLPFELVALEVALTTSGRALESETADAERVTLPTLERLAHKVSTRDLEEVKNHKSTINRLLVRVGKTKQVIEAILDDDKDMQDMYLERRAEMENQLAAQQMENEEDGSKLEDGQPSQVILHHSPSTEDYNTPMAYEQEPSLPSFPEERDFLPDGQPTEPSAPGQETQIKDTPATGFSSIREEGSQVLDPEQEQLLPPMRASTDNTQFFMRTGSATTRRVTDGGLSSVRGLPARNLSRASTQQFLKTARIGFLQGSIMHTGSGTRMSMPGDLHRTTQLGGDLGLDDMQTIVWTRNLSEVDPRDIEGCEDMLEGFLNEADANLSRLDVLKERIDATEALISIQLDSRRNDIVSFDLVMTMATTCMAFTSMTASIFGQNLFFNSSNLTAAVFLAATLPSLAVSVCALVILLALAKRRQLVFQ